MFFSKRAGRKFPRVSDAGRMKPGDVKKLELAEYSNLRAEAIQNKWSARGRDLSKLPDSAQLYAIMYGPDPSAGWRCIVAVHLPDREISIFTLDMTEGSFGALPNISDRELVQLMHDIFMLLPMVPLDDG